jgi:cellulose synthase/poly-beta-1,6-N-acetylglucosamine synthase-like glycosyltransferase
MHSAALATFWIAAVLLVYAHAGYPLLMALLVRRRKTPMDDEAPATHASPASCSVILCVHNEEARIAARIRNLQALKWPGSWELVIVCDGCTDKTAFQAGIIDPGAKIVSLPTRQGKAAAVNSGVSAATGEILVFCDVRQSFDHAAVLHLTAPFACESVGAVSGALSIASSEGGGGKGIDAYWQLEKKLRAREGLYDSVVGCTGAIYAVRRSLFRPIPEDTLLDDVVIPMQVVMQGKRVLFSVLARAFDPQPLVPGREMQRKLRTLAGNYQMLFRYPQWIAPWSCRIWWQVISHKFLRLAVPWFMLAALASSLLLAAHPFYILCALTQLLVYALGIVGLVFPHLRGPLFSLPSGYLILQAANVRAFWYALSGADHVQTLWKPANSVPPSAVTEEEPHA